jgi:hypothetical protein
MQAEHSLDKLNLGNVYKSIETILKFKIYYIIQRKRNNIKMCYHL